MTRGYLGTQAVDHSYNVDVLPPKRPVVGDNFATLPGRRAYLHFAEYNTVTGTYSATETLYRGRVRKGVKVVGGVYTIPIEHISEALKQKVCRGLASAKLKPNEYRYSPTRQSKRVVNVKAVSVASTIAPQIRIDEGTYSYGTLLREIKSKWETAFSAHSTQAYCPVLDATGERPVVRSRGTSAGYAIGLDISKGDPLWALGFAPETGRQDPIHAERFELEADEDPRPFYAEVGGEFQILTDGVREPEKLSTALVYVPGDKNVLLRFLSATDTGLVKVSATDATWVENLGRGGVPIEATDKKNLVIKECVRFEGQIDDIIKQCFGLADTTLGIPSKYTASGVLTTDFDFSELSDAYLGRPVSLFTNYHIATKETEVQSLVSPTLAMLGACPRISDSGKIGYVSFKAPTALEANSVEVDDDVWANIEAAKIATTLNQSALINSINVGINKDFQQKDEPGDRVVCFSIDALNELGEARQLNYDSMVKESWVARAEDIAERLNELFTTFHFPVFGRESATVEIPCNWRSKQIKCGDLVKVTHELIYDTPRGALGVTEAMGLVVGRKLAIASGNDILRIRIFAGNPWNAVAPTAKATSYNSTSAYLECSSISLYSRPGDNDLTYFNTTSDLNVRLYPYNAAGSASYLATVTSVVESTKRIYFSSAPLTTTEWTTSGMWVVFADWDNRTSSAVSGFAYLADSTATPSIGTSTTQYHRWGP
jgi:hypothetical protein